MDSFCFQTVGHDVIAAYAECLGLPLIRQELRGTAVNQVCSHSPRRCCMTSSAATTARVTASLVGLGLRRDVRR